MLKGATLCSGIGAPECAAPDIDWLWSSDIEPFPNAVRAIRFPESINLGDMTATDFVERAAAIGLPDVLVAGTPCQAFSVAGLRQSLSDDRGNLTLLFVRICDAIDDLRRAAGLDPLWVVWENVPGVLSTKDNAFGSFLAGLGGHDAPIVPARGHRWSNSGVVAGPRRNIAWRVLDAQYFGVPQRRRRVFAIARGGVGNWHGADALLPITESLQWHPAPSRKARKEVARGAEGSIAGNRGAGWPADIACTLDVDFASKYGQNNQHINSGCPLFVPDIANSLGASPACSTSVNVANGQGTVIAVDTYNASIGSVAPALCTQGDHASGNGAVMLRPTHALTTQCGHATEDGIGRGSPLVTVEVADTLGVGANQTTGFQSEVVAVAIDIYNQSEADVFHTIRSHHSTYGIPATYGPPVAFAQNTRDEVRLIGGDGQITGALAAQPGMKQTTYVAEKARSLTARHDGSPCDDRGPNIVAEAFQTSQSGVRTSDVHATLDSNNGPRRHNGALVGSQVRRLTPRECERLQGLPDDWTAINIKGKPAADAPRYKALGNSMAVPVMRYILDRVKEVNNA